MQNVYNSFSPVCVVLRCPYACCADYAGYVPKVFLVAAAHSVPVRTIVKKYLIRRRASVCGTR
eukprot:1304482-Prymnesium_polylepis.2